MTKRAIVGAKKTGSITRAEARRAFRAVKKARSGSTAGRSRTPVSAAIIERYLGHFGVGPSKATGKNGFGVKKSAAKKSAAKKVK